MKQNKKASGIPRPQKHHYIILTAILIVCAGIAGWLVLSSHHKTQAAQDQARAVQKAVKKVIAQQSTSSTGQTSTTVPTGTADGTEEQIQQPTPTTATYTSQKEGYSFQYPLSWSPQSAGSDALVLQSPVPTKVAFVYSENVSPSTTCSNGPVISEASKLDVTNASNQPLYLIKYYTTYTYNNVQSHNYGIAVTDGEGTTPAVGQTMQKCGFIPSITGKAGSIWFGMGVGNYDADKYGSLSSDDFYNLPEVKQIQQILLSLKRIGTS
jgi:hypothetical protein